jgi:MFS family permease
MHAFRLGTFWFGIQVVWTAMLGVVFQERATALAPDPVTAYSVLAAIGALLGAAVQVAAGLASDRLRARVGHRRLFYGAGVALAVPAVILLPAVPSLAAYWGAALLLQIGMNLGGGPYQGIVADYVEPDRIGRASSWMSVLQFSGSTVGLLLTTQLHGLALGTALAACLIASWWAMDAYVARLPRSRDAAAPLRVSANMWTVLISRALINVGFYTLFGYLFFFVRESLRVSDVVQTTGMLFLAFTISGVFGAAVSGRAADRMDKRVVVSLACAAIAVAVGAFAAAPTIGVALACAIGAGAAWGAFLTADWAIAYAVLPRAAMASAMGVWNLAAALPQVAAPVITRPVVGFFDARSYGLGPRIALVCVIIEFVLGTAWLWRLRLAALTPASRQDT